MPKIQDYSTPQYNAPTNAIESASGLAQPGSVGRAMQGFGDVVSDTANVIYKRKAQEETTDLNAKFAEARNEWATIVDEETRNGTIDSDKVSEKLREYVDGLNQDISTFEGRSMYEKESARLVSSVTISAARGQAAVAGAKAENSWRTALANNSSALMGDPSQFEDIYQSTLENIDLQVQSGVIPAAMAEKFKRQTGQELAKGAVRGWADLNPDLAQKKLDSYDQFWDSDVKAQMQGYIDEKRRAVEVDAQRSERLQKEAQKKRAELWEQQALGKLVSNEISADDVVKSPALSADQKKEWLRLVKQRQEETLQDNPAVKNELFRRIYLPDDDPKAIRDKYQLSQYVGRGLSVQGFTALSTQLNNSPEGKAIRDNRRQLMDYASARLVKKNSLGMADPRGEELLSAFMADLQQAEDEFRKEGKNPADLYNPRSRDYFGNSLDKYRRTQKDIMQETIQEMRRVNNSKEIDFTRPKTVANPRRQGESIDDYLKRSRGGG